MSRIVNSTGREYHSELRAQQAEATRSRILDATVRVLARGIASVSIPEVAREAHVSVPTIYRHFATKTELLAAVYPYLERRAGLGMPTVPTSIDELRDGVHSLLARLDAMDDLARAAVASPGADEVRRASMPRRLQIARGLADNIAPGVADADRDRIARLIVILTSTTALRTWRDHLGVSDDGVAEDLDWILRVAAAAATAAKGSGERR